MFHFSRNVSMSLKYDFNVFFGNRVSYIPSHPQTCYIAKDAPKCWDYKPMPPCLIYTV